MVCYIELKSTVQCTDCSSVLSNSPVSTHLVAQYCWTTQSIGKAVTHAHLPAHTHTTRTYIFANCVKIKERRTWLFLVLLYKGVVRGAGLKYITERFTRCADVHAHCTRNKSHRFVVPMHRTCMLGISFRVTAVGLQNALLTVTFLGPGGVYVSLAIIKERLWRHLLSLWGRSNNGDGRIMYMAWR